MTTPHEVDVPEALQAITRRLDDTQDLLEAAVQHLSTLEDRLRRHDYAINDLHWDAARILTSDNPDAATTPEGHQTLRAVQDGGDHLVQDLRTSTAAASTGHTLLTSAGRQVGHAQRLIGELGAVGGVGGAALTAEVAVLATRTQRLATLVEGAIPLAERAQQQLSQAQEILQRQVSAGAVPDSDLFQRFWAVDVGIFDGSRAVAQARTTSRDGAELLERALHTATLTAVQTRNALRQHTPLPYHPSPPPPGRPPQPAPASDRPTTTRPRDHQSQETQETQETRCHTPPADAAPASAPLPAPLPGPPSPTASCAGPVGLPDPARRGPAAASTPGSPAPMSSTRRSLTRSSTRSPPS